MKLEEQLLPHKDLKPLYVKAIWVYVYRTFKKDEDDRAAERASIRFSVTSWPQLLLVDPISLKVTQNVGRTAASFRRAFDAAQLGNTNDEAAGADAVTRLVDAEVIAQALEGKPRVAKIRTLLLEHEDIVVRTRALEKLSERAPKEIASLATRLLSVPNDTFRYLVCAALAKHPDPKANDALEGLVKTPANSRNPNVLRMRAVQALAESGSAASVAVITPHATSGAYFNGLTGVSVDALAAIAKRHTDARPAVREALLSAYPKPPEDGEARKLRACVALAMRVHKALGSKRPFPKVYDGKARDALMERAK